MGIIVPDILSASLDLHPDEGDFFFRLDQHWTPTGARAAAQATSEAIRETDPKYQLLDKIFFETRAIGTTPNNSAYRRILNELCGTDIADEILTQYRTVLADEEENAANLFADLPTEVVLVGTSYSSRVNSARDFNFSGFLSEHLSLNVANEAIGAAGAFGAIEAYLLDETRSTPTYLIWEIPLRAVPAPDGLRQIAGAVAGPCEEERIVATATSTVIGSTELAFEIRPVRLGPTGGRIDLSFQDTAVLDFEVVVEYENGTDSFPVQRSRRVTNRGRYLLDLAEAGDATILRVKLSHLPEGTSGAVDLRICSSP